MRVVFQHHTDSIHLSSIEAEHQSECELVKVFGEGHLSVNGHLHKGGTQAESAELALDVYRTGGIDSLCDSISGEFALVILDRHKLYLIASLHEIVPLYWGITNNSKGETYLAVSTSFAEVAEVLHSMGEKRLQPNPMFFSAFIGDTLHLLDDSHQTISPLIGIERVPGSCWVEIDFLTGKQVLQSYWDVNRIQVKKMDLSTALSTLSEAIESAVRECFSHGRVAISLSGGIDSGSLAFFASKICKSQCFCLTAGLDQWPEIDETAQAFRTAKHLGLEFHAIDSNDAFPFCGIEPKFAYKFGLPVYVFHEGEECRIEAARSLGANVLLYGIGGDELFGIGHTPGYIRDLIRQAKFSDAFTHLMNWTRRLGMDPLGVISAARKVVHWSPPAIPPFLVEPSRLVEHLTDPAAACSNSLKPRVRRWAFSLASPEARWIRSAICAPRDMRLFHPLLSREVVEASFAIPQWFIQHPGEYKWLLKRIMKLSLPDIHFCEVPSDLHLIDQRGMHLVADRFLDYFGSTCRLSTYGIVSSDIKDYIQGFTLDPRYFERSIGGTGTWLWNTISAEMWLRGFEEAENL